MSFTFLDEEGLVKGVEKLSAVERGYVVAIQVGRLRQRVSATGLDLVRFSDIHRVVVWIITVEGYDRVDSTSMRPIRNCTEELGNLPCIFRTSGDTGYPTRATRLPIVDVSGWRHVFDDGAEKGVRITRNSHGILLAQEVEGSNRPDRSLKPARFAPPSKAAMPSATPKPAF